MVKIKWKSAREIEYLLSKAERVAVFTCDFCANLSQAGGKRGMAYLRRVLEGWGKEVVLGRSVVPCCSEAVMRQAMRMYGRKLKACDALVVLSCPTGLKTARLCDPDIPLVCPLEAVGGSMITGRDDLLARSVCSSCDHCVISYTGGICPLSGCPSGQLYGPCENSPKRGDRCTADPGRRCIWKEIEVRGDLEMLRAVERLHGSGETQRLPGPGGGHTPPYLARFASWIIARTGAAGVMRVAGLLK